MAVEQKLNNLKVIINANGWGAYSPISLPSLVRKVKGFGYKVIMVNGHNTRQLFKALNLKTQNKPCLVFAKTKVQQLPFLKSQDAHYYIMNEENYRLAFEILK